MNIYVYDDFLNKSRYRQTIEEIEIRLTDLGLNGKIIRLGGIKNIKSLIQQEIRNGAKNIIAVGNNLTVNKVVEAIISDETSDLLSQKVLFSLIPVGDNQQSIALSLGIKKGEEACNALLARRIKTIDVGLAGLSCFLNKAEVLKGPAKIELNPDCSLEASKKSSIAIYNLPDKLKLKNDKRFLPDNGILGLLITGKSGDYSYFPGEKFKISGAKNLILDESLLVKLPAEITLIKKKLNVVVGKDRYFE